LGGAGVEVEVAVDPMLAMEESSTVEPCCLSFLLSALAAILSS